MKLYRLVNRGSGSAVAFDCNHVPDYASDRSHLLLDPKPVHGYTRCMLGPGTIVEDMGRNRGTRMTHVWRVVVGPYKDWTSDVSDFYFEPISALELLAAQA